LLFATTIKVDNELVISELSGPATKSVVVLNRYAAHMSEVIVWHSHRLQVVQSYIHV